MLAAPEKEKDFFSSLLFPGFLSFGFTEIVAGRSRKWWFGDRAPKKNIFAGPERQPLSPGGEKWPFSLAYTVKKDYFLEQLGSNNFAFFFARFGVNESSWGNNSHFPDEKSLFYFPRGHQTTPN